MPSLHLDVFGYSISSILSTRSSHTCGNFCSSFECSTTCMANRFSCALRRTDSMSPTAKPISKFISRMGIRIMNRPANICKSWISCNVCCGQLSIIERTQNNESGYRKVELFGVERLHIGADKVHLAEHHRERSDQRHWDRRERQMIGHQFVVGLFRKYKIV